ncbi:DUF3108 domain-containing protein [Porphyromonadaceae bacterium W3.11]|nr:DUF3108 domain-containing protein [Porphyromonadaceae bacterium W3.11]
MIKYNRRQFAKFILLLIVATVGFPNVVSAQEKNVLSSSTVFNNDETFEYKLIFKWGVIRGKVGEAKLYNKKINSGQQYFSKLTFRSVGIGDAFYSLRDTFETLYSSNRKPLRFEKRVNDDGYIMFDEISFKHSPSVIRASVKAYVPDRVKVDTVYTYNPNEIEVVDMLSTLAFVRGFDLTNPEASINGKRIVIPIGRSQVYTECQYGGTEVLKKPDGSKVETVIIILSIQDEAFENKKDAVTVWVSRDEYQIPLKVTGNLKVGRVVVELTSYYNKSGS